MSGMFVLLSVVTQQTCWTLVLELIFIHRGGGVVVVVQNNNGNTLIRWDLASQTQTSFCSVARI